MFRLSLRQHALRPRLVPRTFSSTVPRPNVATSQESLTDGEKNIIEKLTDRFSPSDLVVKDVSGGCGTFYAITIASGAFKGLPTVKQHQLVTKVLKAEIEGIHGLQIKTIVQ